MPKSGDYNDLPILAELYDLVPGYNNRTDINFYVQWCKKTNGTVLELGCGTGRILLPVADAGCLITGLDLSPYMLSECQKKLRLKATDIQGRVQLLQGDMTKFSIDHTFDLVIIPFRAFQHLVDVTDQLLCLRNINRHLEMNGKLIIDLFFVDFGIINKLNTTDEIEDLAEYELNDGRRIRRTHRRVAIHPSEQYNEVELIYYLTHKDGTTERIVHAFPMRYFFRYEMEHLLKRCGFKVIEILGDYDKSPLVDASPEMIFIAEKRGSLNEDDNIA